MIDHLSNERLIAAIHQTPSDAERESIDRHLAECPTCRARHDGLDATQQHIRRSLALDLRAARPSPQMTYAAIVPRLGREKKKMNTLALRRRLAFTIIGAALASTLLLTLFYPGGVAAAAQHAIEVIRSIVLGEYSRAVQTAPGAESDRSVPSDVWIIRTEIGNFAGNAPPGVEPRVQSLSTLEEAQSVVNFHILSPAYLPEGYALREVKLAPIGDTHWVLMFYTGPTHDIIVVQTAGGPQPGNDPNVVSGVLTGFFIDGTLEEIDLDGQTAIWIDGHALGWAVDNMTYEVGGLDLTLEEAKQIARSLR
ncbi:MAG TPA: zf-HC2 domain-containing protein [Anaerolineae bacterium]|nr:zf-HC2 domain-containing protein [Anaerolineae bacterium]